MKITSGGYSSLISISRGITCFLDNQDDTSGIDIYEDGSAMKI